MEPRTRETCPGPGIEELPFDILELIGKKLHRLYMIDLIDELYDLFDNDDSNYTPESDTESDSDYSFVESD